MIPFLRLICLSLATIILGGCMSTSVETYKAEKPTLMLEEYFNGSLDAHGIFTDRAGKVKKRFHCLIQARWHEGVGTLDESFTWSDGTKSKRVWTIKKAPDGTYTGTAADVVGEAKGKSSGNAFYWEYTLALDVDGKTYNVWFEDWMYLMDEKVLLNKSVMSKFGFKLGEVTLSFYKR